MPGGIALIPLTTALALVPVVGLPDPQGLLSLLVGGSAWPLWLFYRARLGNPLQVLALVLFDQCLSGSLVLASITLAVDRHMDRLDLLRMAMDLSLLCLLPWLWGVAQAWRLVRRQGVHRRAAWLRSMVDLERWVVRTQSLDDPHNPAQMTSSPPAALPAGPCLFRPRNSEA